MLKQLALFSMFLLLTLCATPRIALAQQKETPVSNREIAERLTRLEEGQKALAQRLEDVNANLNKRIDDLRAEMNSRFGELRAEMTQRFEGIDQRFEGVNQRFEGVNQRFDDVNRRFDDVNRRFDDMNDRFNDIMTFLQIIVSVLVALVLAIAGAGFVMWRKILQVESSVQIKLGLDQAVREQVIHLEQEVGFIKGKLQELSGTVENLAKGRG
jgi:ABC-type multidrug transport system fused ATPase/permease subunit